MIHADSFLSQYDGVALSPILFLKRAVLSRGDDIAVIDGKHHWTWRQYANRCERIAVSLQQMGIGKGSVVSAILPNTHELLELHFAIPLAGGILNALSTRTDAATLNFVFEKLTPKILFIDQSYISLLDNVTFNSPIEIIIVDSNNPVTPISTPEYKYIPYESLITENTSKKLTLIQIDEQEAISINSTSGTSGQPKLVVYSHRGTYLNAISNILDWDMPKSPTFLWTLPMFHCNGWCFPWAIAARAGTHICMKKFDAEEATKLIQEHNVTHYCGAPIIHYSLGKIAQKYGKHFGGRVYALIAGAPPTEMVFSLLDSIGITATHVYGLTETYGPVVICENKRAWEDLPSSEKILKKMRQGIVSNLQGQVSVIDENNGSEVPFDGKTLGEIAIRGNIIASYNPSRQITPETTSQWFYTGDLAVVDPDGYIKIIDRKKDIIISGGENISSLELENALSNYPGVLAAAIVAKPDPYWGEVPYAFIEPDEKSSVTAEELNDYICTIVARYKRPKGYAFLTLPRNVNGKIMKDKLREYVRNSP
ncbi:putative chain-fatty-acid-CoA ligase FadD13 [Xenorhabdus beddingii]|uniref:Putative chain-fatty-acid-CoA ligase FadD13 n=1 Tax=Xenorhabdus beddingii TaxID=40578 RepID=A0A1Y2SM06_9GAMM|nr:AMP-binding protein [Xenorhabdus beddingii]OTA18592.1 putative chain-fatty-acid-CoA ligase FadD13 [Xenorhabdus beddingii]